MPLDSPKDPKIAAKADLDPQNFALANCIRALSIDAVNAANSGHPGAPMGMADAATVLFRNHLKFDAKNPDWPDRDRFVLSNGHASMLLYSLLHLTGYEDMTLEQVRNFRQWGSITAGHPEYGHAKGIETTTGPLGQGLATAVGMATTSPSTARPRSAFPRMFPRGSRPAAGMCSPATAMTARRLMRPSRRPRRKPASPR
jgi:transketolase